MDLDLLRHAGVAWCDEATFARLCDIADAAGELLRYSGQLDSRAAQLVLARLSHLMEDAEAPEPVGEVLLPASEWQKRIPRPRVFDPDGWRLNDGVTWETPITEADYRRRVVLCTVDLRQMLESQVGFSLYPPVCGGCGHCMACGQG